ncbi:MAG TPA: hypothetical protein VGU69_16985 [Rhizomicrobium sp.]|nr:hypothetical protein [Rhizomicrobium sp.]
MTSLLAQAIKTVEKLSPESQDEIARAMLALASDPQPLKIDPRDLPAVLEGLAQIRRGEFATEEEIEDAFRRFGS